jgi:hypothetical protein
VEAVLLISEADVSPAEPENLTAAQAEPVHDGEDHGRLLPAKLEETEAGGCYR